MVTQMLRQSDAEVFKLYSQAKLGMMREALAKLDRQANEREVSSTEGERNDLMHIFGHTRLSAGFPLWNRVLILKGLVGRAAEI
ncbi:MAG TPA: hypothetical protein VMU80_23280 [Bryobacteraceae bacterium]|nr:hypothetical protein [Bryobacteraceae bacterium]